MNKEIGKIQSIRFGYGGYQDGMIGISVTLGGTGWGASDFKGTWAEDDTAAEWTEEDRLIELGKACLWLKDLLKLAGKTNMPDLKDIPIEATFKDGALFSWRILTEVL